MDFSTPKQKRREATLALFNPAMEYSKTIPTQVDLTGEEGEEHIATQRQVIYKCEKCACSFKDEQRHDAHQARCSGEGSDMVLDCTECGAKFNSTFNLNEHLERTRPVLHPKPIFKCAYCPRTFDSALNMVRHKTKCARESGGMRQPALFG
eukprot:TRINITY_DN17549_c0_g1_i3.p3 TRINITY_DN17549_c0_g1~~TRINITY_DN17549_c0_g1_i3.p3  ORF type:complete len:151 (+),score=54.77 TRINITY_DN17549_c0_g1_i3:553-1005(+)